VPNEQFRLIGLVNKLGGNASVINVPQLQVDYDMFFRPRTGLNAGPVGGDGIGALSSGTGNFWLGPNPLNR